MGIKVPGGLAGRTWLDYYSYHNLLPPPEGCFELWLACHFPFFGFFPWFFALVCLQVVSGVFIFFILFCLFLLVLSQVLAPPPAGGGGGTTDCCCRCCCCCCFLSPFLFVFFCFLFDCSLLFLFL